MPNQRSVIHSDDQLRIGSDHLEYHVRMYIETLVWLINQATHPEDGNILRNTVIEDHLIHARTLIDFFCKSEGREDEVFATNYFHDLTNIYQPLLDGFLDYQAQNIGDQLVRITTKPMPGLKSEQEWLIRETSNKLIPAIKTFLNLVPDFRLTKDIKKDFRDHLAKLPPPQVSIS
jgi:hypothetical protein